MPTKDPKSKRDYSSDVRELLTQNQQFRTDGDGIIEYRTTNCRRAAGGGTCYVTVFDVIKESSNGFVFGPTYSNTEYLTLSQIERGTLEPIE